MNNAMRYVYGSITFIGVIALIFACLVALQRVLGWPPKGRSTATTILGATSVPVNALGLLIKP
jgi:hypothetical protein